MPPPSILFDIQPLMNGGGAEKNYAAESNGFHRIPAWTGWQKHYNRREFWHYQFDEGLTWEAAMKQL